MSKGNNFLLKAIICVLFLASGQLIFAQNAASPVKADKSETEKWREDLSYMAQQMPQLHNNLFHTVKPEQFDAAVKKLHDRIPLLARHQIIVEMARIAAMVGDGHTNVYPTRDQKIGFRTLPLKMYFFKDGLYVRAAGTGHENLVGSRVVKIGNSSVDEAYSRVREIIGRDNEWGAKFFAPHLLAMPEVLHALGITAEMESAKFTVESDGKQRVIELKPAGLAEMMAGDTDKTWIPKAGWTDLRGNAQPSAPLWLKDPNNKFWYEYLPDSKTVYVQINEIGNKPDETLANFSKRLFDFVDGNSVEKFILDLRLNRGGNGELNRPLLLGLIKSAKINQKGKLFTLIGRSTFSAAQFLVNDLEKYTNTLFVGEPSASKGNLYGDSRRIFLPNSGMTVRVSIYYWQDWHPQDTRRWTAPDLTAELTSEDYRLGRDPALAAALSYVPRPSLSEVLDAALAEGGIDLAVKRFHEFSADPVNAYASVEMPLLTVGQRLLNEKNPGLAAILFELNAEKNPHSFMAYFALGEAYARDGKKELALANFEKSLQINPKNYDAIVRYRQIKGN